MTAEIALKAAPSTNGSVQSQPKYDQLPHGNSWILQLASIADTFTPWGVSVRQRDAELRAFWPTEPILAGAVYTVCVRNAMQTIELDGPPRTVSAVQDMFDDCDNGGGLSQLFMKVSEDIYCQDNGAFIELVGRERETDAVTSLNHLDSAQCRRTGRLEEPVIWSDPLTGAQHHLKWYQVIVLSEMPSPIRTMYNVQYSALTRILRAAQIMRDISIMDAEKAAGRFTKRINLVSGVQTSTIEDKLRLHGEGADNRGLTRYVDHLVIGSLDPTANVSVATIDLAEAPEGFNPEVALKWYINNIAMAFGEDYQTFAPLPGGNLGSSQQSKTLEAKSKGKGPKAFTKMIVRAFRQQTVTPKSVTMGFEERDAIAEQETATVQSTRAETRAQRIQSGEITAQVARNIAQDDGDLKPEYMPLLEEADANADITISDEESATAINEDVNDAQDGKRPVAVTRAVVVQSQQAATEQQQAMAARGKAIADALDEVRQSREALVRLKAESEEEVKATDAMKMAMEAYMEGMKAANGNGGNGGGTHVHLDKMLVEASPDMLKALAQPAPIINFTPPNIEVFVPEQKERDVMPVVEAIAAAIVDMADALRNQPAAQIQVDAPVTVEMPRIKAEHTTVLRDANQNMTGTEKSFEYEDAE